MIIEHFSVGHKTILKNVFIIKENYGKINTIKTVVGRKQLKFSDYCWIRIIKQFGQSVIKQSKTIYPILKKICAKITAIKFMVNI